MKKMNEKMEIVEIKKDGNWTNGRIGRLYFTVRHFDEGSVFGIQKGKISCMYVWEKGRLLRRPVIKYDRGWDQMPKSKEAKKAYELLLKKYN